MTWTRSKSTLSSTLSTKSKMPPRLVRQNKKTARRMGRANHIKKPTHDLGQPERPSALRRSIRLGHGKLHHTTHVEPQKPDDMDSSIPAESPQPIGETVRPTNKRTVLNGISASVAGFSVLLKHRHCSGCTPDLLGEDDITEFDWCVRLVKHQHSSTSILANYPGTQYWHWVNETSGDEDIFEHQVRQFTHSSRKTTWGTIQEPGHDFHLRLAELTDIKFAVDSCKIIIGTKQIDGVIWRGDVLADFLCNHVKWRFLMFMEEHRIGLAEVNGGDIETEWNRMNPEVPPQWRPHPKGSPEVV
ncbi:hypothetical protein V8F06_014089 [Rhypophila decipiens]